MSNEELIVLYNIGDKNALNKLIENNMGIIYKIVNKYKLQGTEEEDLIQCGIVGMIKGIKKYDIDRLNSVKVITYVIYWVNREINNFVNGKGEKEKKNNKLYKECISLNKVIGEDGEELGEIVEGVDYGFENIIEIEFIRELREQLEELMFNRLTLREREILKLYYGWNTNRMTMIEIAEIFELSAPRIRQIKENALIKLRNSKWVRINAMSFYEMGYINKYYFYNRFK